MCNKIKDKQYCLNHILREENDVNIFENKRFFEIKNFENYETFFFFYYFLFFWVPSFLYLYHSFYLIYHQFHQKFCFL